MSRSLLGKRVAILVETEYIYDEIEFYKRRVPELGGEIVLMSYLWGKNSMDIVNDIDSPDRPITSVHRLTITECVSHYDPNEFDIIICAANYPAVRLREIPPMGSLGNIDKTGSPPAVSFFARAMENKKIVKGAMCHALWILTPHKDLLKGRKVICHSVVLSDIKNTGAIFVPAPTHVVIDSDLVTARSFSDIEDYFEAIVSTCDLISTTAPLYQSADEILNEAVSETANRLQERFNEAKLNYLPGRRSIAAAAQAIIDGSLDLASEIRRLIGVDFDPMASVKRKPILIVASKFGTWASELTIVAGVLIKAGYAVKVATEDGTSPHFLSASLDPDFLDGAWRDSVVTEAERDLALKFLKPGNEEHSLMQPENIFNLSRLPKPPQIGDYIKHPYELDQYKASLHKALLIADEYEAIVITGGSGAIPGLMADRGLHSLILAFHRLKKPIMGECNGGLAVAQTMDPQTGRSILEGRAVTTHSWLDEYQSGWGWVSEFNANPDDFWVNDKFDLARYSAAEKWHLPGINGNPLIDSEAMFTNAAGTDGLFFSPPGTPYSVVVDDNLITCRTTPDGYPGILALIAILDGLPALRGRLFLKGDTRGLRHPSDAMKMPAESYHISPLEIVRKGDVAALAQWLEEGGNPNWSDDDGWTPLLLASALGNSSVVELLLFHDIPGANHADPDIRFPGANGLPIYMAGQLADLETIKVLLRFKPWHLFDVATVNGHTLLLQAAFYGQKQHQNLAKYLLDNIAEILSLDSNDNVSIKLARTRLLSATNVRGQNALSLAKAYNVSPMVKLLEQYSISTEQESAEYYIRLLRRIAPPIPINSLEYESQQLTDKLIDVIENGFVNAAEPNRNELNDDIILAEIDVILQNQSLRINRLGGPLQRTPIIIACTGPDINESVQRLRRKIVKKLLLHNANPLVHEIHAMGINAVTRAAVWGHLYALEMFSEKLSPQCFLTALNEKPLVNGYTALHDSVHRGLSATGSSLSRYLMQIDWLLKRGARHDIEDNCGRTQKEIAGIALADPDFKENAKKILEIIQRY